MVATPVERAIVHSGATAAAVEKGTYRHFMQKEIFEQPTVVAQTLSSYIRPLEQADGVLELGAQAEAFPIRAFRQQQHGLANAAGTGIAGVETSADADCSVKA